MSEVFLSDNGNFEDVKYLYKEQAVYISGAPDNIILLLFDKDWNPVSTCDDAKYSIVADYTNDITFSYIDVYVNGYVGQLEYFITSGDYKSALLCTDCIYHQEVKNYNGN
jgi:hypothetical protein